jgi:HlyD family secretion protein
MWYTVMVSAPNPESLLLPGMTADARIVVEEHPDVIIVPNSALSFRPGQVGANAAEPMIWVRTASGRLHPTAVSLGATGDSLTEIRSPGISVGDQVAVGYRSKP